MGDFTKNVEQEMQRWATALYDYNGWLDTAKPNEIVDFLNDATNLCTPGFVLRRHLKSHYTDPASEALSDRDDAIRKIFSDNDAAKSRVDLNVAWDKTIVDELSNLLGAATFTACAREHLGVNAAQWQKYLTDKSIPNRETLIKLSFALRLSDETLSKLLLSAAKNPLSVRNPIDYICMFCRNCNLTFDDVIEMMSQFESESPEVPDGQKILLNPTEDQMTIALKNETALIAQDDTMNASDKKQKLLQYMNEHANEFTVRVLKKRSYDQLKKMDAAKKTEYASGFSMRNIARLKLLLKYLTVLYPNYTSIDATTHTVEKKPIEIDDDGVPKTFQHLTSALLESQGIELKEVSEFITLPTATLINITPEELMRMPADNVEELLTQRPKIPREIVNRLEKIPFNKSVVLMLRNLPQTLRATMRPLEYPASAQGLDRETVLTLTYFLIMGCRFSPTAENFIAMLEDDLDAFAKDATRSKLCNAIMDIVDGVSDTDFDQAAPNESPLNFYIDALNGMLESFELEDLYLPFVIDRCVLLCLLADPLNAPLINNADHSDELQYLINLIIGSNYQAMGAIGVNNQAGVNNPAGVNNQAMGANTKCKT